MRLFQIAVLVVAVGMSAATPLLAQKYTGVTAVTEYFDLLVSGNVESAEAMWTPEARERASRFGIEYEGIPLKIDCGSPVVRNLEVMASYLVPPVKVYNELDEGAFARMQYSAVVGDQQVEHLYYAKKGGEWYWLCYPQDYFASTWPIKESQYFRIHVHPDRAPFINTALLEESDALLEKLATSLMLPEGMLATISQKKIEFYYCGSDKDVKEITGHASWGTVDLASNDVISASFPHLHELAHLLINMKLQKLSLYTLPVIREGTAVAYGGRWGKDPEALMDLAVFLYAQGLVELDSVLTYSGFERNADVDIAYPVVGLFLSYLVDQLETQKFFELYQTFCRPISALATLTTGQIQEMIAESLDRQSWAEVLEGFDQFIARRSQELGDAAAGAIADGRSLFTGDAVSVIEDNDWIGYEFVIDSNPGQGTFCFDLDERLKGKQSALFHEHFGGGRPFEGYRFAIRFDQNEAGLYDYASNRILAKYISGISAPGEYYDPESGKINIKFRRHLFGSHLPTKDDYKLLPD